MFCSCHVYVVWKGENLQLSCCHDNHRLPAPQMVRALLPLLICSRAEPWLMNLLIMIHQEYFRASCM